MRAIPPALQRLLTIFALAAAFIIMASVFVPDRTRSVEGAGLPERLTSTSGRLSHEGSTDPHEGLARLGELHDSHYTIKIFATDVGALYSVYDEDGAELGVLLTAAQVERRFPSVRISTTDFSVPADSSTDVRGGAPEWPRQFMHVPPEPGAER